MEEVKVHQGIEDNMDAEVVQDLGTALVELNEGGYRVGVRFNNERFLLTVEEALLLSRLVFRSALDTAAASGEMSLDSSTGEDRVAKVTSLAKLFKN